MISPTLCLAAALLAAADPDWVRNGGATARFPPDTYLVGFGAAEGPDAPAAARARAAADLASHVLVRIDSATVDVQEQKDSLYRQQVRSLSRTSTQITLAGLGYLAHQDGGKAWALATIARTAAASQRRSERDAAIAGAREDLAAAHAAEKEMREGDALKAYYAARLAVAEAASHEAVARAIAPGAGDSAADADLADLARQIDERAGVLLRKPVSSLREAVAATVLQLQRQGLGGGIRWVVAPLTYGSTAFSSALGRQFAQDLDVALAAAGAEAAGRGDLIDLAIKGAYLEAGEALRINLIVRDVPAGRAVASAEVSLPRSPAPAELPFVPQNLAQALQDQKILGAGEYLTGDLRVEVSTDRGRTGLVLADREQFKLLLRVNKPAYVRLIYILANGYRVPLEQGYSVDASKVNQLVEFPSGFEVAAPFGVERFQVVASTEPQQPLATRKASFGGEQYDVVADAAPEALVKHRGVKRVQGKAETAEAVLTLTTVPR